MRSTRYKSIRSRIYMSFRLVPISVTLNDLELRNGPYLPNLVMALILHYFTEFVCDVVVKQL